MLKHLMLFLLLFPCFINAKSPLSSGLPLVTAIKKSGVNHLYFRGVLRPLSSHLVLSPANSRIIATAFTYGQQVHQGDLLLILDATDLANSYRNCLSHYLQKKAEWQVQQSNFEGDLELFKAGVISQQARDNSRNAYATSLMSLTQARFELEKQLEQLNLDKNGVEKLDLSDTKGVNQALQQNFSRLRINSPIDGWVLMPDNMVTQAEDKARKLQVGDIVKSSQALLSIDDLRGFQVNINVSELDILRIKTGLPVTITGDAFPGVVLHGMVSQVAVQANPSEMMDEEGGLSLYAVTILIPKVPEMQRKKLLVGMSAKVDIAIQELAAIRLPFDAVVMKNGKATVTVIDKKHGKTREVAVDTGVSTPDEITILRGLSVGETVLRHPVSAG